MQKAKVNWVMIDLDGPHWELASPKDYSTFLQGLPVLFKDDTVLYLEDGRPSEELKSFLDDHCLSKNAIIPHGTIWPRPNVFHLPITNENIRELSDLSDSCAEPEVAVHAHVYRKNMLLLQWYDAFADPMFISSAFEEHQIKAFAEALQVNYKPRGARDFKFEPRQ